MKGVDADVEETQALQRENCSGWGSGRGFPLLLLSPGGEKELDFPSLSPWLVSVLPTPKFLEEEMARRKPLSVSGGKGRLLVGALG